ncbi:MAG: GNAT family N-acetyltransferase [Pleurocapsa sp. MO_226.B13]|nr:GNAT family N-acetyltransferase [Pleurocapsa sp. MO_226.B13]
MQEEFRVRLAKPEELPLLNEIENAAAEIFRDTKYELEILQPALSLNLLRQQQKQDLVWLAADRMDRPIGFAVVLIIDRLVHLHELSVLPSYGRQGIGTKIVTVIINWAKQANYPGITLSTFRDIPWNAPFYRQLGFREIPPSRISSGLNKIRNNEAAAGLPVEDRVLMILDI